MDKDKAPGGGGGFPPHSPHYTPFTSASSSSSAGHFSQDVSHMPDRPQRAAGHRRAHSEVLGLPDSLTFDSDLGIVGPGDSPLLFDETEEDVFSMYIDMDKFAASSSETAGSGLVSTSAASTATATATGGSENMALDFNERPRVKHQHSQSMDGSASIKPEMLLSSLEGPSSAEAKKAMSAAKLAELALLDPKRAKRIWANRQSAARSKERKMRYIAELERRVQALQTEATRLSAQLTRLQRDTASLTAENSELKLRLQAMEQQTNLQNALNDALSEEVQRLRVTTGLGVPNGGQIMNFGSSPLRANQQYYHHNYAKQSLLAAQQLQQLQICSQQQQQQQEEEEACPNEHQILHQKQKQQQHPPAEQKMEEVTNSETGKDSTSDSKDTPKE